MTRQDAVAAVALLSMAYNRDMEDGQLELYLSSLSGVDSDALADGVRFLIGTEKWFPTVAAILEASSPATPSADRAWGTVCARIAAGGRLVGARGFDPTTRAAIQACGGWVSLCNSQNPEGDRYTFVRTFKAMHAENIRTARTQPPVEIEGSHQIGHPNDK